MKKQGQAEPYIFLVLLIFIIAFTIMNFDKIKEKVGLKKEVVQEPIQEEKLVEIPKRTLDVYRLSNDIFDLIRKERKKAGKSDELTIVPVLNDEAQKHSNDMASSVYFSDFDLNGNRIIDRVYKANKVSFKFEDVKELINLVTLDQNFNQEKLASNIFNNLMGNQAYKDIILDDSNNLAGIGISFNHDYYDLYLSVVFAKLEEERCGYAKGACCFGQQDFFCFKPLTCSYRLECDSKVTEENIEKIKGDNLIAIEFTSKSIINKGVKNYLNIDNMNDKIRIYCDKAHNTYYEHINSLQGTYTRRLDLFYDGKAYGQCGFFGLILGCYTDLRNNLEYQGNLLMQNRDALVNSKVNVDRAVAEINEKKEEASIRINSYNDRRIKNLC